MRIVIRSVIWLRDLGSNIYTIVASEELEVACTVIRVCSVIWTMTDAGRSARSRSPSPRRLVSGSSFPMEQAQRRSSSPLTEPRGTPARGSYTFMLFPNISTHATSRFCYFREYWCFIIGNRSTEIVQFSQVRLYTFLIALHSVLFTRVSG